MKREIAAGLAILLAAPAIADSLVEKIDACLGQIGTPEDHSEQCIGIHAQPCMADPANQGTEGMVDCLSAETTAWEEILLRDYDTLQPLLDPEQIKALATAEAAWEAFRNADCSFPGVFLRSAEARPWAADCFMQSTARRAMTIRGLLDYLAN